MSRFHSANVDPILSAFLDFVFKVIHDMKLDFQRFFWLELIQNRRAFRDELALLQKLRHPNIVQFLGAVTQSSPLMIVTEYLSKVCLSFYLEKIFLYLDALLHHHLLLLLSTILEFE